MKLTTLRSELTKTLSQVLFSVARDDTRPILTGVLFLFDDQGLFLVSSDGFRLSQKKIVLAKKTEKQKVILPKSALSEISRMDETEDIVMEINNNESQVVIGVGNYILGSRV